MKYNEKKDNNQFLSHVMKYETVKDKAGPRIQREKAFYKLEYSNYLYRFDDLLVLTGCQSKLLIDIIISWVAV